MQDACIGKQAWILATQDACIRKEACVLAMQRAGVPAAPEITKENSLNAYVSHLSEKSFRRDVQTDVLTTSMG